MSINNFSPNRQRCVPTLLLIGTVFVKYNIVAVLNSRICTIFINSNFNSPYSATIRLICGRLKFLEEGQCVSIGVACTYMCTPAYVVSVHPIRQTKISGGGNFSRKYEHGHGEVLLLILVTFPYLIKSRRSSRGEPSVGQSTEL